MNSIIRFFILLGVLILPLVISFIVLVIMNQPNISGTLYLARDGMKMITIYRDDYGIPHIKASNKTDIFYGMGFAHAQDRLWNMHIKRMLYSGRLSELFGSQTIIIDKYIRTIGIHTTAQHMSQNLSPEIKQLLESYCHGINDYISTLKILPLEFLLTFTGYQSIEPWTVVDILAYLKYLQFSSANDWTYELLRANLMNILDKELIEEVIPFKYEDLLSKVVILDDDELKKAKIYEEYKPMKRSEDEDSRDKNKEVSGREVKEERENFGNDNNKDKSNTTTLLHETLQTLTNTNFGWGKGSNSWVISGKHTESGKPLLACDPHSDNTIPSMYYQIELIYEDHNIIGVTLPGLPIIPIGKTKRFSYGSTALYADITDLYNESLSSDGKKYLYEETWHDVLTREETIKIKGSDPIKYPIRSTRHGPILETIFDKLHIGRGGQGRGQGQRFSSGDHGERGPSDNRSPYGGQEGLYSLTWTGYLNNDTSLTCFLKLWEAKVYKDIVDCARLVIGPANSLLYAFENGDIGYIAFGKIPKRRHPEKSGYISDGTKAENDWIGLTKIEENPQVVNPSKGYIISANNKFSTNNIKHSLSINMATTARADRIQELILQKISKSEKFNVNDMKEIQLDVIDIYARDYLPLMMSLVKRYQREILTYYSVINNYTVNHSADDVINDLLTTLSTWNGNMTTDSIPASIYTVWEYFFFLRLFNNLDTELRFSLLSHIDFDQFIYKQIIKWYHQKAYENKYLSELWCQNHETIKHKDTKAKACIYNLIISLYETYMYLSNRFGMEKARWKYGNLYQAKYNHVPFSQTPFKFLYHREHPTPGNKRTINAASSYLMLHDFKVIQGSNYRMVVDMANQSKSYYIIDTGISESYISNHYDDQQKLHQDGKYLEMKMGMNNLKHYKDILFLAPLKSQYKQDIPQNQTKV